MDHQQSRAGGRDTSCPQGSAALAVNYKASKGSVKTWKADFRWGNVAWAGSSRCHADSLAQVLGVGSGVGWGATPEQQQQPPVALRVVIGRSVDTWDWG